MRASVLAALLLSSIVLAQPATPPFRRHHARAVLQARQSSLDDAGNLAADSNSTVSSTSSDVRDSTPPTSSVSSTSISSTSSAGATTSAPAPTSSSDSSTVAPTSSDGSFLDGLLGGDESASPTPSLAPTSSTPTPPSTLALPSDDVTKIVTHISTPSVKTVTSTSAVPSTSTEADNAKGEDEKIGGLPKTTFIIIIAVASAVVLVAVAWTAFRKWKLRPSRRFDSKMKPVNFDPQGMGGGDDFLEKTLNRSHSHSSLDRQRQQFIADLDKSGPDYVEGVPQHDFTAGTGMYDENMYNNDPFAHSAAYDYDTSYYHQAVAQPAPAAHVYPTAQDYPTQDQPADGYHDLQRGNSGSSHGSGHGGNVRPSDFPTPDQYIGRPTEGDGPYAQASRYGRY